MPLSLQELRSAQSFLRQAHMLTISVRDLFRGHDSQMSARLGDIAGRLDHEGDFVQRLIWAAPGGESS